MNWLLDNLNPQQLEAVTHHDGPLLILAGAGSGKTRVITHRIAHLIEAHGVRPASILAVTFTNKATDEMRARIQQMVQGTERPIISTFHSYCARLLRRPEARALESFRPGFNLSFGIADENDQAGMIRAIYERLGLTEKEFFSHEQVLSTISRYKNCGKSRDDMHPQIAEVWEQYDRMLRFNNYLDFDDLLIEVVNLLTTYDNIRQSWSRSTRFMLVDEFQDTNRPQYEIARLLTKDHGNLCVVGDEDQTIYSWRGADIRNILDFRKDFPGAREIRLEQNYRSTQNILDAAGSVIEGNKDRVGKTLWTESGAGYAVDVYSATTQNDEARFVAEEAGHIINCTGDRVAILYRFRYRSRIVEKHLRARGIRYSVLGTGFYSRNEVRDILAFIRVSLFQDDSLCLERIINTPPRGIGFETVKRLKATAESNQVSLWRAIEMELDGDSLGRRQQQALSEFRNIIARLSLLSNRLRPSEMIEEILEMTGYSRMVENRIESSKGNQQLLAENKERLTIVRELVEMAAEAEKRGESLIQFTDSVSLATSSDGSVSDAPVSLMTVHASKGLEFPVVFVIGMEEGTFPSARATSSMAMEEERRTCYVAMTRARERLVLTWSRLGPNSSVSEPSRFLGEIDSKLTRQLHARQDNELAAVRARVIRIDEIQDRLAVMAGRRTRSFQESKTNALR
jgi:DNA helicase II / ATP-dependent DNA helicase PcrA